VSWLFCNTPGCWRLPYAGRVCWRHAETERLALSRAVAEFRLYSERAEAEAKAQKLRQQQQWDIIRACDRAWEANGERRN
jgi:hypothetical protein